jgi:ribonucrease Y
MLTAIIGLVALLAGIVAGKFIFAKNTKQKIDEAEAQARKIVADAQTNAETIKQQKQLEAKEKFLALRSEYDKEVAAPVKKNNRSTQKATSSTNRSKRTKQ